LVTPPFTLFLGDTATGASLTSRHHERSRSGGVMRVVTIASLGASAVLGLGALVVAKTVLPNASSAKAAPAALTVGVPIVVANKDIKYGTKLEAGMLSVVKAPTDLAPQGAFSSVAQVLASDKGGPPVALVAMSAREPILPVKISGPGARATVAAEVEPGMRAYTVKVNDATGVGGHALPGDRVDVVVMRDLTPQGTERNYISQIVVQNVRVLGIDLNADPSSDKPATPNTATIEVTPEDAQKLSIAGTLGTISLALRRTGQTEVADAGPLRTGDFLLGGARPAAGGVRRVRVAAAGPVAPPMIQIVEGEASKHGGKSGGGKSSAGKSAKADAPVPGKPAIQGPSGNLLNAAAAEAVAG
jgi:pilus assembly protein CpaB